MYSALHLLDVIKVFMYVVFVKLILWNTSQKFAKLFLWETGEKVLVRNAYFACSINFLVIYYIVNHLTLFLHAMRKSQM